MKQLIIEGSEEKSVLDLSNFFYIGWLKNIFYKSINRREQENTNHYYLIYYDKSEFNEYRDKVAKHSN